MPQTPQGRQRILMIDGSIRDEFGNVVQASPDLAPSPDLSNRGPSDPLGLQRATSIDANPPRISGKDTIIALLKGMGLASSFLPHPALRLGAPVPFNMAAAALEGEDPIEEGALQTALGAAGEYAPRPIMKGMNYAALASGGAIQRMKSGGVSRAAEAFTSDADRHPLWPVTIGDTKRIKAQRGADQAALEGAEVANPTSTPLRSMGGANQDYYADAINTADPVKVRSDIAAFDRRALESQAMARAGLDDTTVRRLAVQLHQASEGQLTIPQARQAIIDDLINNTDLSVRDLGEWQRGMSAQGRPVIEARSAGQFVPEDAQRQQQMTANLMGKLRGRRHDPAVDQSGAIRAADKNFSNTATMSAAMNALRSGGPLGDMGLYAMRGALGTTLAYALGINPGIGTAMGLVGLNPRVMSATGNVASRTTAGLPKGYRTVDTARTITDPPSRREVRRRKVSATAEERRRR